jgi:predicted O-methyltransferase YrrM
MRLKKIIEKARTIFWFMRRSDHWAHAVELGLRKFRPDYDVAYCARNAENWAQLRACSVSEALSSVGIYRCDEIIPSIDPKLTIEGNHRAGLSKVRMGGSTDTDLLHAAVVLSGAIRVVETGVAFGWSSLAILSALNGRSGAKLVSVDMPYPKMNNEAYVGIVVPDRLRGSWEILREPDRRGLQKAIERHGGTIDLCHYDSDKSWWGRDYAYPLLWDALRPGGLFMSDDIQDNMYFAEFSAAKGALTAVTKFAGKYVGVIRKPD